MNITVILILAFALAIDAFTVSLAAGSYYGKTTARQKFRLSFHFGLFQFFMPIIGWILGAESADYITFIDHWIAFLILSIIGIRMIINSRKVESEKVEKDISKGFSLVSLSVATSIDALAIGFSIGILRNEIFFPSVIIGVVAAGMSLLGIKIGEFISSRVNKSVTVFGGIVLILIGIHIVVDHLWF